MKFSLFFCIFLKFLSFQLFQSEIILVKCCKEVIVPLRWLDTVLKNKVQNRLTRLKFVLSCFRRYMWAY